MTAKVTIELQANETGTFSELDLRVLNALTGTAQRTLQVGDVKVTEPAQAEAEPEAPAEEKPAAPKRTRRTKAQIEADKAAAEAEEAEKAEAAAKAEAAGHTEAAPAEEDPEDDLLGEDPEDTPEDVSMDDVVAKVTALVRGGKQSEVKEALSKFGAARVSKLADKDLPAFFAEISALEA